MEKQVKNLKGDGNVKLKSYHLYHITTNIAGLPLRCFYSREMSRDKDEHGVNL